LEVLKTFPDKSFDLVLTDPPYGIGDPTGTVNKKRAKNKYDIYGGRCCCLGSHADHGGASFPFLRRCFTVDLDRGTSVPPPQSGLNATPVLVQAHGAMRPSFAVTGPASALLSQPDPRWTPSMTSTDRKPKVATEKVPWLLCIWRRRGCLPDPTSQLSLRWCTRTKSTLGLASSRRHHRLGMDQTLHCERIANGQRIVQRPDPIHRCRHPFLCARGEFSLE
jgi:hypothetical protein